MYRSQFGHGWSGALDYTRYPRRLQTVQNKNVLNIVEDCSGEEGRWFFRMYDRPAGHYSEALKGPCKCSESPEIARFFSFRSPFCSTEESQSHCFTFLRSFSKCNSLPVDVPGELGDPNPDTILIHWSCAFQYPCFFQRFSSWLTRLEAILSAYNAKSKICKTTKIFPNLLQLLRTILDILVKQAFYGVLQAPCTQICRPCLYKHTDPSCSMW